MRYALTPSNTFPFQGLSLFDDLMRSNRNHTPAVDLIQKDTEYLLKIDLPGYDQKDVSIDFENETLTVKGKRSEEKCEETDRVYCLERVNGEFERSFRFKNVDGEKINAQYSNGVLKITLPLREELKAKKITINFN